MNPLQGKGRLLNRLQVERVLIEPVVFHLLQRVQNRTKCAEKPQVKNGARVHLEPSAGKRAHIEPDVGKRELIEPPAGKALGCVALCRLMELENRGRKKGRIASIVSSNNKSAPS